MEFSPQEKNCIVSDEDTFSRADQQGAIESKDYYEPICVAGNIFINKNRKVHCCACMLHS